VPSSPESGAKAWAGLAALLAVAAFLASLLDARSIDWQPGLAWREPWRAWTAALVHLSPLHLAANLAGAVAVAVLGWAARLPRRSAVAWAVAWPLTQWGLLARPDLLHYGGLSGVLHAGVAVAALFLAVRASGARRAVGVATLAVTIAKVVSEAPWGAVLRQPEGWDIAVAPVAHATGLLAGLACAGAAELLRHSRARPRDRET
jgi:rhomboid family GlyGly-CTERM serine protease